ncbi:MFS transporter [Streptomyces vinaceus]|uniref:MFS transporter n=1 Tax=Streptomyces vinaceus TaxID=1960 RepID=UPI0036CF308B
MSAASPGPEPALGPGPGPSLDPDSAPAPGGLRGVFALGGAALTLHAFLARLPSALCPIGTLLLINERDGIGDAGAVAAALWLGQALGGPVIGRLADRRGHRPVLLAACGANAAALVALVTAVLGALPLAAQLAFAVAAGLTVPQVGPLARARWARLAGEDEARLGAALSFDTTLDEVGFMVGPALAGILAVTVHPASALVLAAGLVWAAMAVTSSIAGFVTVARPGSADLRVRLRRTVTAQAVLTLPLLAVSGLPGAALAVAGIGLAVAPHLIALFGLVERAGPAERMGEAMTVVGSGLIVGQALAAAAAGPLAAAYGHRAAFAVSCAAAAASALLAWAAASRGSASQPPGPEAAASTCAGPPASLNGNPGNLSRSAPTRPGCGS